ncbi:MAG: secondary thiamine-phosphate synthase enzyme YjbQ [Candidatus Omnitrophica bacterium]|nr:secondary thiamine-phosphate synthase enzyme YjbQ [Candidatus Omnitrophota bacterium]MDE2231538.1 secondary thiamine-phosphate synthase enzyme YjbQ [Candidatus Omnitrophota bacterium]
MSVKTAYIELDTKGECEMHDLTSQIQEHIKASGIGDGIVSVSLIGSTGSISTIEFEDGLRRDIKELLDRLVPKWYYHHDAAWGDSNAHAHLRSTLMGTSRSFPFKEGKLLTGTWQQIVFIDFDNRPRQRKIVVQMMGE